MTTTPSHGGIAPSLLRLLQLASPALPIGAYAYSQGLESAVEAGWVSDEPSALAWLQGLARHAVGTVDLPLLRRSCDAWSAADGAGVRRWNEELLASRETRELREEERHLGRALARVLSSLGVREAGEWAGRDAAFGTLFALAAVRWQIRVPDALGGYLWAWSENQVLAAVKLVPLGQSAGQRVLQGLAADMPAITHRALALADEELGNGAPSQAFVSMLHESQYSRLFRS